MSNAPGGTQPTSPQPCRQLWGGCVLPGLNLENIGFHETQGLAASPQPGVTQGCKNQLRELEAIVLGVLGKGKIWPRSSPYSGP